MHFRSDINVNSKCKKKIFLRTTKCYLLEADLLLKIFISGNYTFRCTYENNIVFKVLNLRQHALTLCVISFGFP